METKPGSEYPRRDLSWPACHNTRDLGGLPTADGKETRRQSVIRSDQLGRLTEEGRQAMLHYGVRTIIDLRSPQEVAQEPSVSIKDLGPRRTYFNLPLEKYHPHVSAMIRRAKTRGEVYCIILDHYPDAVAAVMRAIIEAPPGGVAIHCHGGTDRTGMVSALLLRLADVPLELVAADYAMSQVRLAPLYDSSTSETGGEEDVDFWSRPTATEEMMHIMLDHLDTEYGGVEGYLRASGLSAEEIERLKSRLRPA